MGVVDADRGETKFCHAVVLEPERVVVAGVSL
jgi:hypothetical protein